MFPDGMFPDGMFPDGMFPDGMEVNALRPLGGIGLLDRRQLLDPFDAARRERERRTHRLVPIAAYHRQRLQFLELRQAVILRCARHHACPHDRLYHDRLSQRTRVTLTRIARAGGPTQPRSRRGSAGRPRKPLPPP